jgi:type III secretion protein T
MPELASSWQDMLLVAALLMARMLMAFSVIPLFVGNSIPVTTRTVFVAGLAFALLPFALADASISHQLPASNWIGLAVKEALLGLVLGLLCSIGFWAVYAAGTIVEYQAGLSMATTIDPTSGQDESLVGTLFMQIFIVLFIATGGLLTMIGMLFDSYKVWPLSSMTPVVGSAKLTAIVVGGVAELVGIAVKVAAPFVILMLLVEIALGLLSRFAPQLNVFFLSLPLKMLVLTLMLLLYGLVMTDAIRLLPTSDFPAILRAVQGAAGG